MTSNYGPQEHTIMVDMALIWQYCERNVMAVFIDAVDYSTREHGEGDGLHSTP